METIGITFHLQSEEGILTTNNKAGFHPIGVRWPAFYHVLNEQYKRGQQWRQFESRSGTLG